MGMMSRDQMDAIMPTITKDRNRVAALQVERRVNIKLGCHDGRGGECSSLGCLYVMA